MLTLVTTVSPKPLVSVSYDASLIVRVWKRCEPVWQKQCTSYDEMMDVLKEIRALINN